MPSRPGRRSCTWSSTGLAASCWPWPRWSGLPGLATHAGGPLATTLVYLGLVLLGGYLLTALLTVLPDALDALAGAPATAPGATEFTLSR